MKDTNTGVENTGDWNSGDRNSGDRNSGYWNSGDRNSGYWNSGDGNSGDWNSGDWNSGNGNSGNGNNGNGNSGNGNNGYGNSTNRESGIFCSEESTVRMFNKDSGKKWDEIEHPHLAGFELNKWIPESEMTNEEKKNHPNFFVREGYLKTYSWEDAWSNFWRDTDKDNRQKFLNLPNFDEGIFKEITGISVTQLIPEKDETINIEGKEYSIKEIKSKLVGQE